ncbi:probable trehalose-phosphate phosphatase H [Arthrobacter sp. Hiyo4]|nr:probable trehalose-phosphate phosphatase H [Arthrobacter sp. Hiyo4]
MTPDARPAKGPLTLSPELRQAARRIAQTEHLLVAMDFDGTISPLVDRADDARPLPRSAAAFAGLAALPRTTTALLSGRALASLRSVASPPVDTLLIGSHGAEAWLGPGSAELKLDEAQRLLLAEVRGVLEEIVEQAPGTLLEDKPAGVVLHTRLATDEVAEDAVAAARSVLQDRKGVFLKNGKRVLETSVVNASKGEGLTFLRQITGPPRSSSPATTSRTRTRWHGWNPAMSASRWAWTSPRPSSGWKRPPTSRNCLRYSCRNGAWWWPKKSRTPTDRRRHAQPHM